MVPIYILCYRRRIFAFISLRNLTLRGCAVHRDATSDDSSDGAETRDKCVGNGSAPVPFVPSSFNHDCRSLAREIAHQGVAFVSELITRGLNVGLAESPRRRRTTGPASGCLQAAIASTPCIRASEEVFGHLASPMVREAISLRPEDIRRKLRGDGDPCACTARIGERPRTFVNYLELRPHTYDL
jgi:hypothetical protein